jgi:ribonuclease J
VEGSKVGELSEDVLEARKVLGQQGCITISVCVDPETGTVVTPCDLQFRGISELQPASQEYLEEELQNALVQAMSKGVTDRHRLQQTLRRVAGAWVAKNLQRSPMLIPIVLFA